jgi:hypothetical protein
MSNIPAIVPVTDRQNRLLHVERIRNALYRCVYLFNALSVRGTNSVMITRSPSL